MDKKIDDLMKLHYKCMDLIKVENWEGLNKLMKVVRFAHDVNKSKTVLVSTQQLINHPEVLDERYLLYEWFNNDMGWPHLKWPVFKNNDENVPDKYK